MAEDGFGTQHSGGIGIIHRSIGQGGQAIHRIVPGIFPYLLQKILIQGFGDCLPEIILLLRGGDPLLFPVAIGEQEQGHQHHKAERTQQDYYDYGPGSAGYPYAEGGNRAKFRARGAGGLHLETV